MNEINIMNTNVKTKNFGLIPTMVFFILWMLVLAFPALAQEETLALPEKTFASDGVELPDWFEDWKTRYDVKYVPIADLTFYEKPASRNRVIRYEDAELFLASNLSARRQTPVRQRSYVLCSVENIERNENETLLTLKHDVLWEWTWLFVDKKTCLIDTLTGDKYMLRDIREPHKPGQLSLVYGLQGKSIVQTLVFPPLKKTVTVVDFYEPDNFKDTPSAPENNNTGGYREYGIALSKFVKQKKYPNAEVIY
jgi:hypothetical protein